MRLSVLLLLPAVSFASPKITSVQRTGQSVSWTKVFDDGLVVHETCTVNLKAIGALSEAERSDRPEAYYQRHLNNLKRYDIKESRVRVDVTGRPKAWDAGRSSEGGAVLFIRDSNDDLVTIRIQATPNSPAIAITNKSKIAEIQDLILTRYFHGGAQKIKDDGFYDRYLYANLEDVFLL